MNFVHLALLVSFGINISLVDMRIFKIRNRTLLFFLFNLILFSLVTHTFSQRFIAAFYIFIICSLCFLLSSFWFEGSGIGFGDIKLIAIIFFGYLDPGLISIGRFLLSLWSALIFQILIHYFHKRKFPSHMAMAPSIFLAVALYMYAPIGVLLPQ